MDFIHWDYHELAGDFEADSSIQMLSGTIKDPETDTTEGFYLRWALRVYAGNQLALSCIAEGKYVGDVRSLSIPQFIKITQHSLQEFKREFGEMVRQTNITVSFDCQVTEEEASAILRELCEQ